MHAANIRVMGACDTEPHDVAVERDRTDDGDVREVRPARERVVEHIDVATSGSESITARTASAIAPRWTGMCSACAIMRPSASKSAHRTVVSLLDVRGVRAANQHRTHLLGDARQPVDENGKGDRVDCGQDQRRSSTSAPVTSGEAVHPGRTRQVASPRSTIAGPVTRRPPGIASAVEQRDVLPLVVEVGHSRGALAVDRMADFGATVGQPGPRRRGLRQKPNRDESRPIASSNE